MMRKELGPEHPRLRESQARWACGRAELVQGMECGLTWLVPFQKGFEDQTRSWIIFSFFMQNHCIVLSLDKYAQIFLYFWLLCKEQIGRDGKVDPVSSNSHCIVNPPLWSLPDFTLCHSYWDNTVHCSSVWICPVAVLMATNGRS